MNDQDPGEIGPEEVEPPAIQFVPDPRSKVRKALSVLQLRESGYAFDEIAEILNLPDAQAAEREFTKGMVAMLKDNPDVLTHLRDLTGRRLERLLRAVWTKALDPNNPEQMVAHQRALAVIDRHARLYGLDAATKVDVEFSPTQREMAEFISAVAKMRQDIPQEGNIFGIIEGEVLELEEGA